MKPWPSRRTMRQSATRKTPRRTVKMKWDKPAYQEMRFGFEVTMYILNR